MALALLAQLLILNSSFLTAQPLTLGDPVYLIDYRPTSGGCVVTNCPIQFWDTLTNWWQHTCGTVAGDDFTGFYGGPNRYGTTNGMTWNFHTYNASLANNPGFFGEGFNLAPNYCVALPTATTLELTNVQAMAVYLVCSNFAAVEPGGYVVVRRDAVPFDYAQEGGTWYLQTPNLPGTNRYTQAELTGGAVIGWTGGARATNVQFIADKGGAVYAEFRYTGERRYEWFQWTDDGWQSYAGPTDGTIEVAITYHANADTNFSSVTVGGNDDGSGAPGVGVARIPFGFWSQCFGGLLSLDCGNIGFETWASPCNAEQWQYLNGDITGLEARWRAMASAGEWRLTNYVQLYDTHSLTNYIFGGTGGWETNMMGGTNAFVRAETSWSISLVIANSYLYFDLARFATNSLCQ